MSATARLADRLDEPLVRCRYLRQNDERCTAEALDPSAEVLLCQKHTARVLALVKQRQATTRKGSR